MLRIGFDAKRVFNNFTGLGNYSRNILTNLSKEFPDHKYYLYTPKISNKTEASDFIKSGNFKIIEAHAILKSYWRSFGIKNNIKADNIQIFHGLSNEIPFGIKKTGIKSIVTIHDLIFLKYPQLYPFIDRNIYDIKFRYACNNADIVIAISNATKNDIIEHYQIEPHKIKVIYQPCASNFYEPENNEFTLSLLKKYNLPSSYLLYVGSVIRRKNILNIVEAYEFLPEDMRIPLVIAGRADSAYKQNIIEYIRQNNLEKYIIWLENVSNQELSVLYRKSKIFIYPSKYEGFGIPVLESLTCKVPVITSNTSSLPEAGGNNSYYINPDNPEEIAFGIIKILSDQNISNQMAEAGYEYAMKFKGELVVQNLMAVYNDLIST